MFQMITSHVSLSVCSGIFTIWGPLDFSQDDGNLDEKKYVKKSDQTKTEDVFSQIGKYTNFQIYNSTNQISSDDHLEKKCGKNAIRCFIPDKGQGRRISVVQFMHEIYSTPPLGCVQLVIEQRVLQRSDVLSLTRDKDGGWTRTRLIGLWQDLGRRPNGRGGEARICFWFFRNQKCTYTQICKYTIARIRT